MGVTTTIWRPLGKHAHNNLIGNQISIKLAAFSSRHVVGCQNDRLFQFAKDKIYHIPHL